MVWLRVLVGCSDPIASVLYKPERVLQLLVRWNVRVRVVRFRSQLCLVEDDTQLYGSPRNFHTHPVWIILYRCICSDLVATVPDVVWDVG